MFLIVGLGNPGKEYKNTRHNIGFDAIDAIAKKYKIEVNRIKFKGVYGETFIEGEKVIILKPSTYMNLSGESIRAVMDFYKVKHENILVIYDDISLEVGRLRIRDKGSAGGHNGIKNIISNMGTEEFARIKIGVGQPKGDLVNYVLGTVAKKERKILDEVLEVVVSATEAIIKEDVKEAMNKYNSLNLNKIV
ncbi:aminoacyl-tRNA hydrolase [Clostridium vincentii]|uniref:Peptidyl-tRNA hydrolase n=1 Tax=Clostridium vincentii TaxID=52704 RepID=A0A2T0BHD6_9CLOT|nr:aminoacyl-tRNA hydrolase [Clostridium vincentii]PRR83321.1 Peptidyl-tRNA hydrolase [Clostridium vincentii]